MAIKLHVIVLVFIRLSVQGRNDPSGLKNVLRIKTEQQMAVIRIIITILFSVIIIDSCPKDDMKNLLYFVFLFTFIVCVEG